jgi:hypothetical protein
MVFHFMIYGVSVFFWSHLLEIDISVKFFNHSYKLNQKQKLSFFLTFEGLREASSHIVYFMNREEELKEWVLSIVDQTPELRDFIAVSCL